MKKRVALVIGNSNYIYSNSLKNPINDANDIADKLESLNFDVIKLIDLSHIELVGEVLKFVKLIRNYDVSLLYYAGHGMEINGENYLVPVDFSFTSIEEAIVNLYSMTDYLKVISSFAEKTNIVVLDACRDNPFTVTSRGKAKGGFTSFTNAPKGCFISFSTSPDCYASDGLHSNGLYTGILKRTIDIPNIKIEDTFKIVRTKLAEISANEQISWEHSSLIGDFYFKVREIKNNLVSQFEIYEYVKERGNFYENNQDLSIYEIECLPYIDAQKKYGLPIIEIVRLYSKESYSMIGQNFTDKDIDEINIGYLSGWGFQYVNFRWYFNGEYVVMGDPLPLEETRCEKPPISNLAIDVKFKPKGYFQDNKLYIQLDNNLPDETLVMFSLSNKDKSYFAQSKGKVESSNIRTEGFKNKKERLEDGIYLLAVSTPIYSVQPQSVKERLGEENRNLIGDNVKHSPIGGKTVSCQFTIIINEDKVMVFKS